MQDTLLLKADNPVDFDVACRLLQSGHLVAVPTETVYGLAADAMNEEAVKKIFIAKDRPQNHPLIVHIDSVQKLPRWAKNISPLALKLAEKFWPGPLTLLLDKAEHVSDIVTGGLSTVAVRVPDHPILLKLLQQLDTGLAAPSANPHKRISPTSAEHVLSGLSGKIAAILDAGPCKIGLESTIVDVRGAIPKILRPGPITQAMLEEVLGVPVSVQTKHTQRVAGNMEVHYQPHTPSLLMTLAEIEKYLALQNKNEKFAIMHYSSLEINNDNVVALKMPTTKEEYAKRMYKALHDLDAMNVDKILIEIPPNAAAWSDIHDRLSKAAAKFQQW